ncbi:MAG: hypothetical protein BWX80_03205 [Candidatus Hydrogenedentes bacterium ADurb.Bin101]|nr:MAG: hypothetical protein BWX80_03205 [Candidatus Hydrogenedentes bacterium ADurb.Bin101]
MNIAAGHPAMLNIPDKGNLEVVEVERRVAVQFAQGFSHGKSVQQGLCRMFMPAVSRIDDMRRMVRSQNVGSARTTMAQHDDIGAHCLYIGECIMQRLAFYRAGRGSGYGKGIRT